MCSPGFALAVGVIVNYRIGPKTQRPHEYVVRIEGVSDRDEASAYLGRRVEWVSPKGERFVGSVARLHGNNGAVVVRFRKGLPGTALGTRVAIL